LAPAIINRSFQRGRTEQAPTKYELVINLKTAKAARFHCAGNAARNRRRGDACLRAGALKRGFVRRAISAATVGDQVMANKDIIIGRVINITGMIGVLAGTVLFTFAIVLILFRRGFGLDIPSSIHWFW
jgi:hypothetical protein